MDSINSLHDRMEDYDEGDQGCFMSILRTAFVFMAGFTTAMVFIVVMS